MFERLASRGVLELDDARLAAAHVNLLVMSIPLNQGLLLGEDEPATPHGAQPLRRRRRPRIPRGAPQTLTYTPRGLHRLALLARHAPCQHSRHGRGAVR